MAFVVEQGAMMISMVLLLGIVGVITHLILPKNLK
ncbi:hypothetical protein MM817_01544 [Acidibacillus sp. S0AB]|uniref:Uncharacterized protein n=1 Tax=Sulfoacidibacillus ferrooxidans TaxID=2005001 RepID=A0A9X1V7U1_9BACL|nr:hypothetical protein [Sulfoacidibacillus ferrooxidans]